FAALLEPWRKRGYELLLSVGIAQGYATIGTIGCEGRREYSATGTVCNLAARLCAEAKGGQILLSQRAHATLGNDVKTALVGDLALKGFHRPVKVYELPAQV
ncbi:MAG: guanylate cyclase, partial [Betaproteobacteria bacterium]|nr:guanylate cyclase [Betaproteobacteria bacterium]